MNMPNLDEPEILDGMRGWTGAQRALAGVPDPSRERLLLDVGWYDTGVDDNEGAFCMVRSGGAAEDMVGDVVRFQRGRVVGFAYCVGVAPVTVDIALSRPAFLRFAELAEETFRGVAQPVVP